MNQIQMAAKLYECRASAKFLFGDKYRAKIQDYVDAVNKVSESLKIGTIQAATKIAESHIDGMTKMLVFAAAVEIMEPTP